MKKISLIILFFCMQYGFAQNSMVGDGFGGRLWYKPYNYTVGSYSGYTVCDNNFQLYGWGENSFGQLGNGKKLNSAIPVKVFGMTNVTFYTCGYIMAAIRCDKTGWTWGSGTPVITTPIQVISNVVFADAGSHAATFIKADGTLWTIGINNNGDFGNGLINTMYSSVPQKMDSINNAVRVANGGRTITVLLSDGSVKACGNNFNGCLGNNSAKTVTVKQPVKVDNLQNIVDIKANAFAVLALDSSGDVYQWGKKSFVGPSTFDFIPRKLSVLHDIVAISGSDDGYHFLALDAKKNCYGWGQNRIYFGGGTGVAGVDTPLLVATDVVDILAAEFFSYIIKSDGSLWASGTNLPIWMNLSGAIRNTFTKLDPSGSPMYLCNALPYRSPVLMRDTITVCSGDSVLIKNKYYKSGMTYRDSVFGGACFVDTFKSTSIIATGIPLFLNKTICTGDTFRIGIKKYFNTGIYKEIVFNNTGGCDTVVTINLKVAPVSRYTQNINVCDGDTFRMPTHKYFVAGYYKDTLVNSYGCDSIVTTNINILPRTYASYAAAICEGDTFRIGKHKYWKEGIFIDTLKNITACDSIVTSNITIKPSTFASRKIEICSGDTFRFAGHKYSKTGSYKDILLNAAGCDSVVTTNLTVTPPPNVQQMIEICSGDSFIFGNHTYSREGIYADTTKNAKGCDSIITTHIKLIQLPVLQMCKDTVLCEVDHDTISIDAGMHNSYLWQPNGETTREIKISKAGLYSVRVGNASNCYTSGLVQVRELCRPWLIIPNAFSPDGNGINDLFKPVFGFLLEYHLDIYNRWGEKIFTTDIPEQGWDGTINNKPVAEDIYIYVIEAKGTYKKSFHEKGTFHLIR